MRYLRFVSLAALALLPAIPAMADPQWKAVEQIGAIYMIYVEPAYAGDKEALAQIIANMSELLGTEKAFQLDFFDNRRHVPHTLKYSARNTLHHRARYNYNPANSLKRFGWMVPLDPDNLIAGRRFVEEEITIPPPKEPESALDSNPEEE